MRAHLDANGLSALLAPDPSTTEVAAHADALLRAAEQEGGFLTRAETDLLTLAGDPYSDLLLLVRTRAVRADATDGRFVCAARLLRRSIQAHEEGGECVRDVSCCWSQGHRPGGIAEPGWAERRQRAHARMWWPRPGHGPGGDGGRRGQASTATRHRAGCKRVFSRYDPDCPRCGELANGAAPR